MAIIITSEPGSQMAKKLKFQSLYKGKTFLKNVFKFISQLCCISSNKVQ